MKRLAFPFIGIGLFLIASTALATQVGADDWQRAGSTRNESTGLFQQTDTEAIVLMENAQPTAFIGTGVYDTFDYGSGLGVDCIQEDWTPCSATGGEINILVFGDGYQLGEGMIGTQTLGVVMDADSLDISGDQTTSDGVELFGGPTYGMQGKVFFAGGPAFQFCADLTIADVSGTDEFHVGFRGYESFDVTVDDYLDMVTMGFNTSATPAAIKIETIVADGGTTTTDTTETWAEGARKILCVLVSSSRVVTYSINGQVPATVAALTLAAGLALVPFIAIIQHSDLTEEVDLRLWDASYQQP